METGGYEMKYLTKTIDQVYADLGYYLFNEGETVKGRNGNTRSLFGTQLKYDMANGFPILSMRKIFYRGVVGEFISFLQDAKTIQEFNFNGCNYWALWADDDGELRLDYPPREQLDYAIQLIRDEPTSRRIIIDLWNPDNRGKLSLDPCHTQYQFSVRDGRLDMIWTQRSVDYAVGAPSDFILAALYLITIGNETGYAPGVITFNFGDTHIYEEHLDEFHQMLFDYDSDKSDSEVQFMCNATTKTISQDSIRLLNYEPKSVRKFLLKA